MIVQILIAAQGHAVLTGTKFKMIKVIIPKQRKTDLSNSNPEIFQFQDDSISKM